jgi:hypothetical protein
MDPSPAEILYLRIIQKSLVYLNRPGEYLRELRDVLLAMYPSHYVDAF